MVQKISNNSFTEDIIKVLRQRILSGKYAIGEKLLEVSIAKELQVSRTPVREAFRQLEKEGLVEYIPYRGCFAKGFTKRDIDDIYEIRKALEVLTVEWATKRISKEDIMDLKHQCNKMEEYIFKGETDKAIEVNTTFHDIIYRSAGSRFMTHVLHSYKGYINSTRAVIFYNHQYLIDVVTEHKEILNAIMAKDVDLAKLKMAEHLDHSKKRAETSYPIVDK